VCLRLHPLPPLSRGSARVPLLVVWLKLIVALLGLVARVNHFFGAEALFRNEVKDDEGEGEGDDELDAERGNARFGCCCCCPYKLGGMGIGFGNWCSEPWEALRDLFGGIPVRVQLPRF